MLKQNAGHKPHFQTEFGRWLKTKRQQREWQTRDLAQHARIDVGTVSRIENGHTKATMFTVFQLLDAFSIYVEELSRELSDQEEELAPLSKIGLVNQAGVPQLTIERLLMFYGQDESRLLTCLAGWLNEIADQCDGKTFNHWDLSFQPRDVAKLLSNSLFFTFELKHAPESARTAIIDLYNYGGHLTWNDVRDFFDSYNEDSSEYAQLSRQTKDILRRLKADSHAGIKFEDLLLLNAELDERTVGMIGRAYHSQNSSPETKLITLFVHIWYWFKFLEPTHDLLAELQRELTA